MSYSHGMSIKSCSYCWAIADLNLLLIILSLKKNSSVTALVIGKIINKMMYKFGKYHLKTFRVTIWPPLYVCGRMMLINSFSFHNVCRFVRCSFAENFTNVSKLKSNLNYATTVTEKLNKTSKRYKNISVLWSVIIIM